MTKEINYIKTNKTANDLEKEFISEFKSFRRENNLTQNLLADYSNTSRQKILRIENGITSPTIRSLLSVLGPLGYTIKIEKISK